jgi:acyl-CoA reductase-like NAD-dependent aldehyde dehydrogenase
MTTNGDITQVHNYIGGKFVPSSSGEFLDVESPATLATIGKVGVSNAKDVDLAVSTAQAAFPAWSSLTVKARAAMVSYSIKSIHVKNRYHVMRYGSIISSKSNSFLSAFLFSSCR